MKTSSLLRLLLMGVLCFVCAFSVAGENLLQQVQQRGLKVGLDGTYSPFNFHDQHGELVGFEVDFANALAKQLGVKLQLQPTKWGGMLVAVESKRFDVIINQVVMT